jgi:PglZ domain
MDCMRFDQWLALEPFLRDYFETEMDMYYSILPTATPYARNALFAGLYPDEIARQFPQYWDEKGDDTSRNRHERQLLDAQIARLGLKLSSEAKYVKIFNLEEAQEVKRHVGTFYSSQLVSIVVNFVDILMHARGGSKVLQEIAQDELGFRSLTRAWFENSPLLDTLRAMSRQRCTVILTTDHGSVQSNRPALARGDRETSPNIRYKFGTNVNADERQALIVRHPAAFHLPDDVFNKRYIIAREDFYFVYPTKYEEYKREFMGSFQHGGISLEEMIVPVVKMKGK